MLFGAQLSESKKGGGDPLSRRNCTFKYQLLWATLNALVVMSVQLLGMPMHTGDSLSSNHIPVAIVYLLCPSNIPREIA